MTQYAVLIYGDESAFTDMSQEAWAAMMDAHNAFGHAVVEQGGKILGGEGLAPSATATSVRGGAVTDGPFVETKEQLGGFILIEARDLNEAIQLASKWPGARYGDIEVRPVEETLRDDARY